MHQTVLLNTFLEYLDIKKNERYIDATVGEGNTTKEILNKGGLVLALDWDPHQIKKLSKRFAGNKDLLLVNDNFANIKEIALKFNFVPVAGIVFDLGLSMNQLLENKKGFSYKNLEEKIDMRINPHLEKSASDLLNKLSEKQLADIFFRYGEEINGQIIARAIIKIRKNRKIEKIRQLIKIIDQTLGRKDEMVYRRIFQALRMAVNNELDNLEKGLKGAMEIIHPQGKIVVISFHSIESRLVKNFIKKNHLKLMTKKIIKGERSSQLRVFGLN